MREKMIFVWRKLVKFKILTPLIRFIRWFAGTNFFNTILDFFEVQVCKTDYSETAKYIKLNKRRIKSNVACLQDRKSKMVYRNLLKYRASHKRKYLKGCVDHTQYFDKDIVCLKYEEHFVDCGAYKGDTIVDFIKLAKSKKINTKKIKITAFEPDDYNFGKLVHIKKKYADISINIRKEGTWSKKDNLGFKCNVEEACMIAEDGEDIVHVNSIDNVLKNDKVTFIKMDVEGAELESLKGAEKIIARDHPRLAISIYHSDEDMIGIIEFLREKYPFYSYYVRHYTYFFGDTVLYAVDRDKYDAL